jgi:hypothetical protein
MTLELSIGNFTNITNLCRCNTTQQGKNDGKEKKKIRQPPRLRGKTRQKRRPSYSEEKAQARKEINVLFNF